MGVKMAIEILLLDECFLTHVASVRFQHSGGFFGVRTNEVLQKFWLAAESLVAYMTNKSFLAVSAEMADEAPFSGKCFPTHTASVRLFFRALSVSCKMPLVAGTIYE